MGASIYDRIKELCAQNNITIARLERSLGFTPSSISKWTVSSPSIDRVSKVADYFNVSLDYLYGRTDIQTTAEHLYDDANVVTFQRGLQHMDGDDINRTMIILKAFHAAFDPDKQNK